MVEFGLMADQSPLIRALQQSRMAFKNLADTAEAEGVRIDNVFEKLRNAAVTVIGVATLRDFGEKMMRVRGEFQQLEVAFTTMLGSEEKANNLLNQLVKTAATTPFDLKGVVAGAKSLMAYGTAAENVNETLVRLGDIAAGMSIPLNDLVYLYGTTMTQGRMFTQDLRQFQGRGIPIAEEIAKVMNVSKAAVAQLVTDGKVTSDVFQQAILNMSSATGRFGGLMENQSKTITGQLSNIEDAVDMMFNDFGKKSEGVINAALGGVSKLIENYETIGKVLLTVIASYGAYKGALLAVWVAQRMMNLAGSVSAFMSLARSVTSAKDAMALFNLVTKNNPIGFILSAVTAAAMAFGLFKDNVADAAEISEKFGENAEKATTNARSLFLAIENTESTSKVHHDAVKELSGIYKDYGIEVVKLKDDLSNEADVVKDLVAKHNDLMEAIRAESVERQKANAIQTFTDEYQKQIETAWADMKDEIGGAKANTITASLQLSINEHDLVKLGELKKVSDELYESGASLDEVRKAGEEYHNFLHVLEERVKRVGQEFGLSDKKIAYMQRSLIRMGDAVYEANGVLQKGIAVVNEGSKAVDGYSDAAESSAYANRLAKASVAELQTELQRLIDNYNNTQINVRIKYEEIGVPKWMSGLDLKEVRRLAETFTKIAKENPNGANVNGKWFSGEELLTRAAEYTKAATEKQAAADKAQRDRERAEAEAEKNRKKAEAEARRRAAAARKAENEAERNRKETDRYRALEERKRIEEERAARDLEFSTREAENKTKKGSEKIYAELLLDYDRKMEQQRRAYEDLRRSKIDSARELWEANPKNKKQPFVVDENAVAYTEEEIRNNQLQIQAITQEYEDALKAQQTKELESLYGYLREYGTIQQQKYSIAREYDIKIAKADDENERRRLEAEKTKKTAELNANSLAQSIDWSAAFSGVGNVLKDVARQTLSEVEAYMNTDEFKSLTSESKKSYTELREKLRQEGAADSISPFNFKIWGDIQKQVKEYQTSVVNLRKAQDRHTEAVAELERAERQLANATDDASKEIAQKALAAARVKVEQTAGEQTGAQKQADDAKRNLTDSTNAAAQGIDNFTGYLNEMSSGSLYGFANGMTKLITSLMKGSDGVGKALGELGGKIGGIIGAILQILDAFGDDPEKFIDDLLKKVGDAIEGIIRQLPTIITTILKDVVDIVKGIVGGVGSWFGVDFDWLSGSNAKEVARKTEELTASNDSLRGSIDRLKNSVDKSNGTGAIKEYMEAYKAQKQVNAQQLEILKTQMGYHSSHHSNAYYWGLSQSDYKKINALLGTSVGSLDDIYTLTPEQMDKIRTYLRDVWGEMLGQGKYDKSEFWEAYADEAGKLEELTEQVQENLTQVSFDGLRDAFVSSLMDMNKSSRDFAKDFEKYMMQALLNFAVGEKMDQRLRAWYEQWAKTMEKQNGQLTEAQIDNYRQQWQGLVDEGLKARDELSKLTGYDSYSSEDNATYKASQSFTQEQGDVLNGRLTAIQIASTERVVLSRQIAVSLQNIAGVANRLDTSVTEIRNMMIYTNSYLEDIAKYTKKMYRNWDDLIFRMERSLAKL